MAKKVQTTGTNANTAGAGRNNMATVSRAKAEEVVLVRILIIALVDIIVSMLFKSVGPRSSASRVTAFHMQVLPVLKIVFPALLLCAVVFLIVTLLKKIDTSAWWVTPVMLTAVALYLTVAVLFFDSFWNFPAMFYVMTVIVSVLFAVYYIYTILLYRK